MTGWLLVLYFHTGMVATLQRPFATREACEIAAAVTERRIVILEALQPAHMPRLAYAGCVTAGSERQ